ncbi:MAG: glycosyltransferase family 4 protein [Bacteroidales bacterium]
MLPLGAMLGAWTGGGKFIVHRHEYEIRKSLFYRVSENFMNKHASLIICVSGFLYSMTKTDTSRKVRLYNALPAKEIEEARASKPVLGDVPAITMVSSLRRYKGVDVFAGIAEEMNWCRFTLILSATDNEIRHYFYKRNIPSNLVLINNVNDLHPFYSQANIVVNLSQSDSCIETFGMTILEAMSFGIPVIVPRTGGITELVDDGQNGLLADTSDPKAIADCIKRIISDKRAYQQMSLNALEKSYKFNPDEFKMQIRSIVEKVTRN